MQHASKLLALKCFCVQVYVGIDLLYRLVCAVLTWLVEYGWEEGSQTCVC